MSTRSFGFTEKTFARGLVTASIALTAVTAGLGAVPMQAVATETGGVQVAAVAQAVGAEFTYKQVAGQAVITGYTGAGGKVEIPSTLGLLPVTAIADGAFERNHSVTEVVIPEGVTSIGDRAFNDCTALTSVSFPSTLQSVGASAFYTCGSLAKVELPAGVTSIGNYAFFGCQSLVSAAVPGTVGEWGAASFGYCYKLESVTIGAGVAEVPERTFRDCKALATVQMPASVKTVGRRAFQGCPNLPTCDLSHVESVGAYAFNANSGMLSSLNLASVKRVEEHAFENQSTAGDLALPCIEYIGSYAFAAAVPASASFELTLPATLTTLEPGALSGATEGLKSVKIDPACAAYKSEDGVVYSKDGTELICVPAGYVAANKVFSTPAQVTKVAAYAFAGLNGVEKVMLGDSVTEVGQGAFDHCGAQEVTLSANLAEIPDECFNNANINAIDVPASVKSIGEKAFSDCGSLESVTLHEGLESIGAAAFQRSSQFESIKLPASLTSLDPTAFTFANGLNDISLVEGGALTMKDGQILADGGTRLVLALAAAVHDGVVTIPEGVTTIGSYATGEVCGNNSLRVPDSVTTIEDKGLCCSVTGGGRSDGYERGRAIYASVGNQAVIDYANQNYLPVFSQETPVLSATEFSLDPGQTAQLGVTGILSQAAYVTSDNSVASVDQDGVITAVAGGEADIFVCAGEKYFSAHVKVSGEGTADEYAGYARVKTTADAASWFAADAEYNKPLASSAQSLTGIYLYSSENYSGVNAFLEPGGFKAGADDQYGAGEYGEFEGIGGNASSELGQFKIHENVVVYSGLEDAEFIEGSGLDVADVAAMAGKTITVKPVLSTSLLQGVADRFRKPTNEKILLEIYVPKDSTQGASLGGASVVPDEQEVTFAPGTKFYVVDAGVRYADSYGYEPDQAVGTEAQRYMKLVPVTDDEPMPTPTPDPTPDPEPTPDPTPDGDQDADQGTDVNQAGDKGNQPKRGKGSTPSTGDAAATGLAGVAAAGLAVLAAWLHRARTVR